MLAIDAKKRQGAFTLDVKVAAPSTAVALFGPSGCGKTTLVNLIAGLLAPDEGRIELDRDVLFDAARRIDVPAEQRRVGYVFQDARLFPHYSVRGNLEYGARRTRAERRIELERVIELLALGALLDRRPSRLSGGERQRVAIGRALLSQPRLLLLDEPLASLDVARREEVLPYLERLRDELKIPMVYVSHQFEEVLRIATFVVLMDRGRVVAQGDVPTISLLPELRELIGSDAIGAVVEGRVAAIDASTRLAEVAVGNGRVNVAAQGLVVDQPVRLQFLARDLILALEVPRGLSVRNRLRGVVASVTEDEGDAALIRVDIGGAQVVARITASATRELGLKAGSLVWVLVKSAMLRGHVFRGPSAALEHDGS